MFATAHEPGDCFRSPAAIVRIVDANGATVELMPGAAGNFFASAGAVMFPAVCLDQC